MSVKARTLDFTGVKDGGGSFRPRRRKEGDYYAHITAVADHTSKDDNEGWVFTIQVDGDTRASYPYYVNFDTKQLWKSRNLCIAAGIKVPSAKVKLDPNKLVGKAIGLALEDDEYEGRIKSTIGTVFPIDELTDPMNVQDGKSKSKAKPRQAEEDDDEEEDDEEEPAPKKSKSKKSKKSAPEPDEDDEEEDDDEDEDDEPPAKSKKSKGKATKRRQGDDDEEDEEDDEDEPPAKSKSKKTATKNKSKKKSKDDEDEDDEELDLDDL